jgi:hypothetical protein
MSNPDKKKPEFSNNEFLYENSGNSGPSADQKGGGRAAERKAQLIDTGRSR